MWHCKYAKEPFNARLFTLRCLQNAKWILVSLLIGVLVIGGGYYLKNVTLAGSLPYKVVTKLFVEYEKDPETQETFSYFTAYTWNDFVKSEKVAKNAMGILGTDMAFDDFTSLYEMTLPSDLRMPYLNVTNEDGEEAEKITKALLIALQDFAEEQDGVGTISVVDTVGPKLVTPDIRTMRACILGAILGTFFALFALAIKMVVDGGIYLPETFAYRYDVAAVGYADLEDSLSKGAKENAQALFSGKEKVAITALEEDIDIARYKEILSLEKAVCIPSLLQVPEASDKLAEAEAVLLLLKYGSDNVGAIEELLHSFEIQKISLSGVLLVEADGDLIRRYRGRKG